MKKIIVSVFMIITLLVNSLTCFAVETQNAQYPVKVNVFKIDLDFSKEKTAQKFSFKVDSDVAEQLSVSVVDTSFELQGGKTIFTEAAKNPALEKYLSFEYNPTVDIVPGKGGNVDITVTQSELPEGVYYKGVKVSYATKTTVSSVLIPVIINNLTPGKVYNTSCKVSYVKVDGDYVVKSPFQVCIGLQNDGDKAITNLSGRLTIKDSDGTTVGEYPISSSSIFFAGGPKELRIPVTTNLVDGNYTAEVSIVYDTSKPSITGIDSFEVKKDFDNSTETKTILIQKELELPSWVIPAAIGFGLLIILLIVMFIILISKKNDKEKKHK